MANNLTKSLRKAYDTFYLQLANFDETWQKITSPLTESDPTYVESDIYGLKTFEAQVDSPTAKDLIASSSETSVAPFEEIVKVRKKDVNDNPRLLIQMAADLARLGGWTLTKAFWDAVKALDVTVHPENGGSVYTAQGGGTVYFADEFTIDPPNDAAFNQANLFTDALTATALSNGIAARREYLDKSGNPADQPNELPWLIVPPELETKASDLFERKGEIYDGSGLQSGSFGKRLKGVITLPGKVADANDWFLWWNRTIVDRSGNLRPYGPVIPWLRVPPQIEFFKSPFSNHLYIVAYMEYAIHYRTFEGDVQMHKVA